MSTPAISNNITGYRDLDLRFKSHPLLGDVRPLTDIEAIKNSIKIILLTRRGEKPFRPDFGSNVPDYLFENATTLTKKLMGDEIIYSINKHEPRVSIQRINITDNSEQNAYLIRLDLLVVNTQQEIDISLVLKRLR